jgi:colicin import membrane protein
MKEIVSAYEDEQAEAAAKAKAEEEAKAAAGPKEEEIGEDSTVTIGGKEVTIKDAVNCYRNKMTKKNAADAEAKKKAEEEKKNAEDAEKKKKEEEEAAAAAKNSEEKKKEEEKKNALEKERHFRELEEKANNRGVEGQEGVSTIEDKRAKGRDCYGSK